MHEGGSSAGSTLVGLMQTSMFSYENSLVRFRHTKEAIALPG